MIVINTSCSGICNRIYVRQKFLNNALTPNGALAGIIWKFAGRTGGGGDSDSPIKTAKCSFLRTNMQCGFIKIIKMKRGVK